MFVVLFVAVLLYADVVSVVATVFTAVLFVIVGDEAVILLSNGGDFPLVF